MRSAKTAMYWLCMLAVVAVVSSGDVVDVDVVVVEGFSNVDTRSMMGLTKAAEKRLV